MVRNATYVSYALIFLSSLAGCKVFVAEKAFVNGGNPGEAPVITRPDEPNIPLLSTEATLRWAAGSGQVLDREAHANPAIVYYGHKEKIKTRKQPGVQPQRIPVLTLAKTVKKGRGESEELYFDKPPPSRLIYRFKISNAGSAAYCGRLELVDNLPDEVTYLGVKEVHERHTVYVPYIGEVERKHKLEGWHADPSGGKGTRVEWLIDNVEIKAGHWLTVDIEFEPPPFEVGGAATP